MLKSGITYLSMHANYPDGFDKAELEEQEQKRKKTEEKSKRGKGGGRQREIVRERHYVFRRAA